MCRRLSLIHISQTPTENVSEPSDDPQADKPARTDTEPPEYLSPEEIQASATGEYEEVGGMLIDTGTGKDKYQTDPVPEGKPIPVEPEDVEIGDAEYTCTLSISCATILDLSLIHIFPLVQLSVSYPLTKKP